MFRVGEEMGFLRMKTPGRRTKHGGSRLGGPFLRRKIGWSVWSGLEKCPRAWLEEDPQISLMDSVALGTHLLGQCV